MIIEKCIDNGRIQRLIPERKIGEMLQKLPLCVQFLTIHISYPYSDERVIEPLLWLSDLKQIHIMIRYQIEVECMYDWSVRFFAGSPKLMRVIATFERTANSDTTEYTFEREKCEQYTPFKLEDHKKIIKK